MYEIQRGYNQSEKGVDNEAKDTSICTAGTFNKLVEKLTGIHPDVQIIYMTKETATTKFQKVVYEEAIDYLQKLAASNPEATKKLLTEIEKSGGAIGDNVWNGIKDRVSDKIFEEFSSLYPRGKQDNDFVGLMDSGEYVQLEEKYLKKIYELQSIVRKEAVEYLQAQSTKNVAKNAVTDIWPHIKDMVFAKMYSYHGDIPLGVLSKFVDSWHYTNLEEGDIKSIQNSSSVVSTTLPQFIKKASEESLVSEEKEQVKEGKEEKLDNSTTPTIIDASAASASSQATKNAGSI